jgi:hypothetical protein
VAGRGRGNRADRGAEVVADAQRVGLASALRTAKSRDAALHGAADAIEDRLVGPATASTRMSVLELLGTIEQLDDRERAALLRSAGISNDRRRLTLLHARTRVRLATALRELAARAPESGGAAEPSAS